MKESTNHVIGNPGRESNTDHAAGAGLKPGDNRWRDGVWLRPSVTDDLPDRVLGYLPKHNPAAFQTSDGKAVQQISSLKHRPLTPIFEGGTVTGGRRLPEGIPGGRLIKGLPHGRDAV